MKTILMQMAGVIAVVALCAWLAITPRGCDNSIRTVDGHTVETVDGHEYIRSHVLGGYTYTHLASCRYCKKGGRP